jgi:hypothetical protein
LNHYHIIRFPLTAEFHQLLPAIADLVYPPVADLLWMQAFNLRTHTQGLDASDLYDYAYQQNGWDFRALHWVEEQDDFLYTIKLNSGGTTKARSMVCNVFVCAMWKASGMFDDQPDFQCSETTYGLPSHQF